MKTIGLLGGIGPHATMDIEARLHRAAERVIPPRRNEGYPPLVVHYCRHPPVLVNDSGEALRPLRPDPRLLAAATSLGAMVDFLVVGSNGAHALRGEIEAAAGRPVLSMIDATLDEVRRRGWRRAGVLAMGGPFVYAGPLERAGVAWESLDAARQTVLDAALFRAMEGGAAEVAHVARDAIATLRDRGGIDGVILGCTELPVMLAADADDVPDLINPSQILAEAAVRAAMDGPDGRTS